MACAIAYGGINHRCPPLDGAQNVQARASWGCDRPGTGSHYFITCTRCNGAGAGCTECSVGRMYPERCPSHYMSRSASELLGVYAAYSNHGVLPCPGGRYEQSANFMHWIPIITEEKMKLEEMNRKK